MTSDLELVTRHLLVAFARHYSETIELAMVNQHCWAHAAAPVDVADLDLVGISALATRVWGEDAEPGLPCKRSLRGCPSLVTTSLNSAWKWQCHPMTIPHSAQVGSSPNRMAQALKPDFVPFRPTTE